MPRKLQLVVLLLLFIFNATAQSYEELSKTLLQKSEVTDSNFEESINELCSEQWEENDTTRAHYEWLVNNKQTILLNSSEFFKIHYFIELAQCELALNKHDAGYMQIDSALSYTDYFEYPGAYYHILNFGASSSSENLDGTTRIRYLKEIIESKVVDDDLAKKGQTLIMLCGILENMHRYMESSKYCSQAMEIFQEQGDDANIIKVLKIMYNNTYHTTEDDSNWEYLHQANEIASRSGDSLLLADVYSSFGLAYYRKGDQLEAVRYYKMARTLISDKGSYSELWAATYQHLSYTILDSVESACKLSKYLLEQCLKNESAILSNAYRGQAWCFAKTGMIDSAAFYLEQAAIERESGEKADASPGFYFYMYEIALLINNKDLALKYLQTSLIQFRKYNRESAAKQLTAVRADFDYNLQKERIKKLRLANELKHERIQRQRIVSASFIILLAVALVSIYLRRERLKKLNTAYTSLVKKNLELDAINTSLKKMNRKKKSKRNGVNTKDEEKIYTKLKDLLEEEKIFKQKDLSETWLAEQLNTNTSYLSSIINNSFDVSFKTLLNKYRIDEARQLLVSEEYSNYSIEGIANEVGYHSRSAFYQAFKQNAGMTPSAYVKTYKQIRN